MVLSASAKFSSFLFTQSYFLTRFQDNVAFLHSPFKADLLSLISRWYFRQKSDIWGQYFFMLRTSFLAIRSGPYMNPFI